MKWIALALTLLLCVVAAPGCGNAGPTVGKVEIIEVPGEETIVTAVRQGDADAVKKLLDEDASLLEYQDPTSGVTLLHVAAEANWPKVVKLLLDRGLDVNARDFTGDTVLTYYKDHGRNGDMIALLQKAGGKED